MNTNVNKQLDDLFRVWDNGLCPGAQVLIRQHGETVYEKCFGYGNLENQLKIKNDSILHVASISKEFTVLSILLLWKEGKLGLDDDIRSLTLGAAAGLMDHDFGIRQCLAFASCARRQ